MSVALVPVTNTNKRKKKANNKVLFWSSECKYSVILDRVNELEWRLVDDEKLENKVNLLWIDVATIHEHFRNIQPWQSINHFPGMPNIARKNRMGQNLNKMLKLFPKEYSFYPRTWILPGEMQDFRTHFDNNGNAIGKKVYIIKPDAGCQGRGIFLTSTWDLVPQGENVVAQLYIKKPLLIDGYKFDLRLYCLVSSVKPLRMYLFQDGLVRMCTEEYVKPTKQNISNVCMHLTNYAVNKHSENFQQPSAKSSEESQDEGSKRSLMWFMNTVRKDRGDAKADWLWRRMGTLCTRTVMSIIPTLSREYDQHFKSFSGVPVDMSKILNSAGYASGASVASVAATGVPRGPTGGKSASSSQGGNRGERSSRAAANKGGAAESEEDDDEEDDGLGGGSVETKKSDGASYALPGGIAAAADSTAQLSAAPGAEEADKLPKTRGSRCFEVLGFDIMLDSNHKPWLIEVNHLPSFGTDSPLDKDIKERLMEQVFSVLPVMADDQQAYLAHHKAESEKRLVAQRTVLKAAEERAKPAPARKRESMLPPVRDQTSSETEPTPSLFAAPVAEAPPEPPLESVAESKTSEDDEEEEDIEDEECSEERKEEIKVTLLEVYKRFSPEKTSKIDRLLAKYLGHEEEFLRFVFGKYSVDMKAYKRTGLLLLIGEAAGLEERAASSPVEIVVQPGDSAPKERALSSNPKGRQPNPAREPSKRYSRSLSPPRTQKRAVASWKGGPEEDAAYRVEVLATHVPDPNEEWMQFELSRLSQFTRIFPPEHFGSVYKDKVGGAEDEGGRDDEGDEDNDEGDEGTNTINGAAGTDGEDKLAGAKSGSKATPIEEILFQTFVQDKRQTMRLRCPLPNRSKADADAVSTSFLPPLEPQSSRSSSTSSTMSGKGVVGWKAPPKQVAKEPPRQPTETQSAAAKRLSQGLSVNTNSSRVRGGSNNAYGNASSSANFSVVLDTHEYSNNLGPYDNNQQQMYNMQQQQQPLDQANQWLSSGSTKASRLLEERNMNRIRMEQAKANSAAVLRQQVFHFDPNYDPFLAGGGVGGGGQVGLAASGYGLAGGGSMMDSGSVGGGGSVIGGGGSVMGGVGHLPLFGSSNTGMGQQQNNQRNGVGRTGGGSFNGMSIHEQQMQQQQIQQLQQQHPNGANNHTQEELLKQLFPSWF